MRPLMNHSPCLAYTASDIKLIEKKSHADGLDASLLISRAALAAYQMIRQSWPNARSVLILTGAGHNAADGFCLAKKAYEEGLSVHLMPVSAVETLSPLTQALYQSCLTLGIHCIPFTKDALLDADVIVDALLGTGLAREISGDYLAAIEAVNRSNCPVLSLDLPSGIHADTGAVMGGAVRATQTLTFIAYKTGLLTGNALDYTGKLSLNTLGIRWDALTVPPRACACDLSDIQMPQRPLNSHKGLFGHVLVIGGNYGMLGAAQMAGLAALRTGAGKVTVLTRKKHAHLVSSLSPELMSWGTEKLKTWPTDKSLPTLIIIGPGLGQDSWAKKMMTFALKQALPLIVDGDALRLLGHQPTHRLKWILTPHPGEASTLLGLSTSQIQSDRWETAQALQIKYGGTIVLKGAGTVIQPHQGTTRFLWQVGNPGMATAGMGDILSGIIGGLVAQGLDCDAAAIAGSWIHAQAGDDAAQQGGSCGLLATDLLPEIRKWVNRLSRF